MPKDENLHQATKHYVGRHQRHVCAAVLVFFLLLAGCSSSYGTYGKGEEEHLSETETLYGEDWRVLTKGAELWLEDRDPYGFMLGRQPGTFAYPPTALSWIILFVPFGNLSIWVWNILQIGAWLALIWRIRPSHALLLIWAPVAFCFYLGQTTMLYTIVLWTVALLPRRHFLAGLAVAWALTKPHVAIFIVIWLVWRSWKEKTAWFFMGGILVGTLILAFPVTLRNPNIWFHWVISVFDYNHNVLAVATWQGPWIIIASLVLYLWYRAGHGGWPWLLSAMLIPWTSLYGLVIVLPALRPSPKNFWTVLGLGGSLLITKIPYTSTSLGWILTGYMAMAWMLTGGPRPVQSDPNL